MVDALGKGIRYGLIAGAVGAFLGLINAGFKGLINGFCFLSVGVFLLVFVYLLVSNALDDTALRYSGWRKTLSIFASVLAVVAAGYIYNAIYWAPTRPFQKYVADYMALLPDQTDMNSESGLPIHGKIVTVDFVNKKVSTFFLKLPRSLKAGSPDEVGTIVFKRDDKYRIASYENGAGVYVLTSWIAVIDRASGIVIASKYFEGTRPYYPGRGGNEINGPSPDPQVLKYLESLLRADPLATPLPTITP